MKEKLLQQILEKVTSIESLLRLQTSQSGGVRIGNDTFGIAEREYDQRIKEFDDKIKIAQVKAEKALYAHSPDFKRLNDEYGALIDAKGALIENYQAGSDARIKADYAQDWEDYLARNKVYEEAAKKHSEEKERMRERLRQLEIQIDLARTNGDEQKEQQLLDEYKKISKAMYSLSDKHLKEVYSNLDKLAKDNPEAQKILADARSDDIQNNIYVNSFIPLHEQFTKSTDPSEAAYWAKKLDSVTRSHLIRRENNRY